MPDEITKDGQGTPRHAAMMKRADWGMATSSDVSRMIPPMWSPMLQVTSMILPRSLEEKNAWRRWYYQHDPIIGAAIDLHTRFPISKFRLTCEDDTDGFIAEEFEDMCEDINLFKLLLDIGQEYYVTGECFPFGIWNESDLTWDAFILLNPDYLDVQANPFAQRDPHISLVKWSKSVRAIVSNGPNHGTTGYIYRHLQETASDILECVTKNIPYNLSPMAVSHLARKTSYFDNRGTSIIDRLFKVLVYQDRLQTAQMAGMERYTTPIEIWSVGDNENPADEVALGELNTMLRSTWNSPQKALIGDHTLRGEMISGSLLPVAPEQDWINKEKYAALMMNESILTNNGPTYAAASVAMDYMASWYSTYRQELEAWIQRNVFAPMARARGYYKVSKRELVGGYRSKLTKKRLVIPKIVWDKTSLRDDYQKIAIMQGLAEKNRIGWHHVYEMLNVDYDSEIKTIISEMRDTRKIMEAQGNGAPMGVDGGIPGGGMPMGGGGGGMDGMPLEMGGGPSGEPMTEMPPETGVGSPGGTTMPPESVGAAPGMGPGGMA